jgi:hypothetical protein
VVSLEVEIAVDTVGVERLLIKRLPEVDADGGGGNGFLPVSGSTSPSAWEREAFHLTRSTDGIHRLDCEVSGLWESN